MKNEEKRCHEPVDVIYEPVNDERSIECYFTSNLHLAYRSYCSKKVKGDYRTYHLATKQCYYCDKYFACPANTFYQHTKICLGIAGIVYKFENNKVISYQDNFKYMGDLPFTGYFDFERTTGDSILHDPKMFGISYCQIYAFHPDLKFDKIVIFGSFQKNAREIYSLNRFSQEHIKHFDAVTFNQLKEAATNILVSQKSLFELFSFEFKFTIDILVKWFNDLFKSKFIELNEVQKQIFVKENPLNWSKTCCICGFKPSTSAKECHEKTQNLTIWFDFTVKQEHLFLKNICSQDDLLKMERLKTLEDCYRNFEYFLEVVVLLDKGFSRSTNLNVLEDQETLKRFFL